MGTLKTINDRILIVFSVPPEEPHGGTACWGFLIQSSLLFLKFHMVTDFLYIIFFISLAYLSSYHEKAINALYKLA